MHRAEAVRSGVTATEDDDVLRARGDRRLGDRALACEVRTLQVVHRDVHAGELAARHLEVARPRRADREDDRVVLVEEGLRGQHGRAGSRGAVHLGAVRSDDRPCPQDRALGLHLGEAAVDHRLLELELRHPVAEQPSDALGALDDDDLVARAGELLRGGEPGGARADDHDALSRRA